MWHERRIFILVVAPAPSRLFPDARQDGSATSAHPIRMRAHLFRSQREGRGICFLRVLQTKSRFFVGRRGDLLRMTGWVHARPMGNTPSGFRIPEIDEQLIYDPRLDKLSPDAVKPQSQSSVGNWRSTPPLVPDVDGLGEQHEKRRSHKKPKTFAERGGAS